MATPVSQQQTHASVAQKDGGIEGVVSSLGLDGKIFVSQLFNFAIVALVVWYLILRPLTRTLDMRKKKIDESLEKAAEIELNLSKSQQKYQERIDQGKVEASKMIEKAHTEAGTLAQKMKEQAKQDIELLVAQAKKNIEIEKQEAMTAVREQAASLIVAAAQKVIEAKIDEKEDKKLITSATELIDKNLR